MENVINLLAVKISEDARMPLWEAACHLIKDTPFTGVSPVVFESKYGSYLPVEYFLRDTVSVRHNHPHNHFLFMASSFGIIAFCSWFLILIYPMVLFIINYRKSPLLLKIIFFTFSALLCHAMFDLVIFEWPCNYIFLFMLGILWNSLWPLKSTHFSFDLKIPAIFVRATGTLAILTVCVLAWRALNASNYYRNGLIASQKNDAETAALFFEKALNIQKKNEIAYKAGVNSFSKLRNPDLTLHYMSMIEETPIKNYAHNNGFTAKAYCLKGNFKKALEYFDKETELTPLSVIVWYNKFLVCQRLGLVEETANCHTKMFESLKLKGLEAKDIPAILANPDYDRKPYLLRKKKKQKSNSINNRQ
jgi:hypothetical protein